MRREEHWDRVYQKGASTQFSWFEDVPAVSLRLIEAAAPSPATRIIDIGGGDSHLVDELVARGMRSITVLDVSPIAMARARARLGDTAASVTWIEADVTGEWAVRPVDIWHDRAVFHFLVAQEDRKRYLEHLRRCVVSGGTAIIATFALDGPSTCSGLPVVRYSPETLARQLDDEFVLSESVPHLHRTPWGAQQSFQYSRFTRRA